MSEALDVLAVGAHPDDVEVGIGGTLCKLADQGYKVGIVDLTDGEPTPNSAGPHQRLEEARLAGEVLGVKKRIILDLPNRRLFDSFEARIALAKEIRRYKPRLVIGLGDRTPTASPDHWQAMQITDAAVFYSRLTKWDDQFGNLPPHTVSSYMHYVLNFGSLAMPNAPGHLVVDITSTLERKMLAARCYQSQFPPTKANFFERMAAYAAQQGAAAGFPAGELLFTTKTIGVQDLMGLLFPKV